MEMPENMFKQEMLCEFLEGEGTVFRKIKECIKGELREPQDSHQYVMGVDLAKHQDYTVITVVDLTDFQVVAFKRFNKLDWGYQVKIIKEYQKKYSSLIKSKLVRLWMRLYSEATIKIAEVAYKDEL